MSEEMDWEATMRENRRQFIATMALQGILAGGAYDPRDEVRLAGEARRLADALMAELAKPKEKGTS